MTPVLPSLPFPAALLCSGRPVAGPPWLVALLDDKSAVWQSAEGQELVDEALPWRHAAAWSGSLALRRGATAGSGPGGPAGAAPADAGPADAGPPLRHFQLAGVAFDGEHWLWQFLEEDPAAAHGRAVVRAVGVLPDTLTISTIELISAATEWVAVIDSLPQMIVLTGLDGRITRCNEAFRRFTSLTFSSLTGRPLAHVLGGAAAPPLSEEYYGTSTSAVPCPRAGWLLVRGFPIHRNAQLRGWVHALEEISAARLTAGGHRPLVAAEQASDGVALIDAELRLQYANPALAELLRLPRQLLLGRTALELGLLPDDPAELELLAALRQGHRTVRVEHEHEGHLVVLELTIGPVIDAGGEAGGFALVVRDVTERERGLHYAEAAAATSDLCHWLGGLRHELGNPVNSVKMALTVLHSHLAELTLDEVVRYVERALSELGRVEYLLRSLKTFTLFDPPELQCVDMASFIDTTVASLESTLARQGISLERLDDNDDGSGPLIATADPRALHQVAMSLVSNAAEAFDGRQGRIQIGAARHDGAIELDVRDTGPGIAPAQVERLFLPFESTKRGSPGLGLTLVRRLVTSMRGTVSIESALGVGTRVRVRLDEVR